MAGVDLEVAPGEVVALLGPNGAGKTTFIEILEGFRVPDAGEVRVLGVEPKRGGRQWRARVGVVFQSAGLFEALSVRELVSHFASFYPAPLDPTRVIAMVGLADRAGARVKRLSGGQKRRVDLALGIVGDPELLFLDEPTTGLDPEGRRQLWEVIRDFASLGKTILFTTHYLEEAEALADRVVVMAGGRFVAEGPPHSLAGRAAAPAVVSFILCGELAAAPPPRGFELRVGTDGRAEVVTAEPTRVVAELARWAESLGERELPGLEVRRPSLEEVYLQLIRSRTGADGADGGGR